jgi:hypothetical protein
MMMLAVPLLWSISTTAIPVRDTVWWRTEGGNVIETTQPLDADCTLHLYTQDSDVNFAWSRHQPPRITISHQSWDFGKENYSVAAMRIGAVWLGGGNGTPSILTLRHDASLTIPLNEPVETLLPAADQITVGTPDAALTLALPHSKMAALLAALRRCRERLGR